MANKEQKINKLIEQCKELSRLNDLTKERSGWLQRMAQLAREGKKESEEFKELEFKHKYPKVIDFGDIIDKISNTVAKL